MLPNGNPIFVTGVFRSGTSLLCSVLNQNPSIALMYECNVWSFPRPLLKLRFQRKWVERIEFYNQALSRHRMIAPNHLNELEEIRTPLELYRAFGERKGATVSGEKSPFYGVRLEQLHKQYPGAFFVLVWRHPVETYRSVLKAGQTSRFFARPGMLSRLIYLQDQAIQQAERIEKKGARIYRVDYARLVDQTEAVCREVSAFLGVPFDPQMLHLNHADLSAIFTAPHHAHLRRGVIQRQEWTEELVSPRIAEKLERYRHRWEHQQPTWLNPPARPGQSAPRPVEFVYHNALGKALTVYDSLVRAGFEFLPLPWLRVYRLLKNWIVNPPSGTADEKTSLVLDCQNHWPTILLATALLALISFSHFHADPHLLFILFYAIPCVLLALVVSVRWASLFVLACSIISPVIQYDSDSDYRSAAVFAWNFLSRLILLEIVVLTIGRIRMEFSKTGDQVS